MLFCNNATIMQLLKKKMLNFQGFKVEKIVIHTLPFKENPTSSLCGIFDVYSRNVDFSTFLRSVIITIFYKHLQYFRNIYSILETQCNFYATFATQKSPLPGAFLLPFLPVCFPDAKCFIKHPFFRIWHALCVAVNGSFQSS